MADKNAEIAVYLQQIAEALGEVAKRLDKTSATTSKAISLKKQITQAEDEWREALEKGGKELADAEKKLKELYEKEEKQKKMLDALRDKESKWSKSLGKTVGVLSQLQSGIKKSTGTFINFAAALGGVSFKLSDLSKIGREYNRALYEVSIGQSVAGKSAEDMADAMSYVRKNTNLSELQFLKLARVMQDSFVGIKPSLKELSDLTQNLARQFGASAEAQERAAKDLFSIQSQFPSLYDEIGKGMDILARIDKGTATDQEKQSLALMRERVLLLAQEAGMSQKNQETIIQALTERTAAEKELNQLEAESQKLTREMDQAKVEFFKSVQKPILALTQGATKLVKIFTDFKEIFLTLSVAIPVILGITKGWMTVTKAIQAAGGAMKLFNAIAKANPILMIAAAIIAVSTAIAGWIGHQRKLREEQEASAKAAQRQQKIQQDLSSLTKSQKEEYDKLYETEMASAETEEDRYAIHLKRMKEVKSEKSEATKLMIAYNGILKNTQMQLGILEKVKGVLRSQISLAEEFGGINQRAMEDMIKMAENASKTAEVSVKAAIQAVQAFMQENYGIEVPVTLDMDMSQQVSVMSDAIQKRIEALSLEEESEDRNKRIEILMEKQKAIQVSMVDVFAKQKDYVSSIFEYWKRDQKVAENLTSAYEANLDTQRKLMESAQFGLGASLGMMQKQVDLAHEIMETHKKTDQVMTDQIANSGIANREQIEAIRNAKTQAEAQRLINSIAEEGTTNWHILNNYAVEHQKNVKKIADQQQKIYDLTKEVREGYLDAIREMSVGAGEFEKIIGTQEVGVTQLMDAVNKFSDSTEQNMLNTMKLGGKQSEALTEQGVGTTITGRYGAGGAPILGFESAAMTEAKNKRIYGYEASKQQYFDMAQGGKGASTVGSGIAAGREEQYVRPAQEEFKINYDSTKKAIIDANRAVGYANGRNIMSPINPAFQNPSAGRVGTYENLSGDVYAWGAGLMGNAQAQTPVNPSSSAKTPGAMPLLDAGRVVMSANGRYIVGAPVGSGAQAKPRTTNQPVSPVPTLADKFKQFTGTENIDDATIAKKYDVPENYVGRLKKAYATHGESGFHTVLENMLVNLSDSSGQYGKSSKESEARYYEKTLAESEVQLKDLLGDVKERATWGSGLTPYEWASGEKEKINKRVSDLTGGKANTIEELRSVTAESRGRANLAKQYSGLKSEKGYDDMRLNAERIELTPLSYSGVQGAYGMGATADTSLTDPKEVLKIQRAQALRDMAGQVKGGEASVEKSIRWGLSRGGAQPWEMNTKDFQRLNADITRAKSLDLSKGPKGNVMESLAAVSKNASATEKAAASAQQVTAAEKSVIADTYGAGNAGSGGAGAATITIRLEGGLEGKIDAAHNVIVNMERASSR